MTLDSVRINPFKGTGELRTVANPTNYSEGPAVETRNSGANSAHFADGRENQGAFPGHLTDQRRMSGTSPGNLESLIQHLEEQLALQRIRRAIFKSTS